MRQRVVINNFEAGHRPSRVIDQDLPRLNEVDSDSRRDIHPFGCVFTIRIEPGVEHAVEHRAFDVDDVTDDSIQECSCGAGDLAAILDVNHDRRQPQLDEHVVVGLRIAGQPQPYLDRQAVVLDGLVDDLRHRFHPPVDGHERRCVEERVDGHDVDRRDEHVEQVAELEAVTAEVLLQHPAEPGAPVEVE